jgi:hypothetical protein
MNIWKNFTLSMGMLQFEGCRLARKHNTRIPVSKFKVSYGQVRCYQILPHPKAYNNASIETNQSSVSKTFDNHGPLHRR